jgi:hypothetical protein
MHEIDYETYQLCLDRLKKGGPVRVATCRNPEGLIPHVMLEWMIREGDAEEFTGEDGHEYIGAREAV